MSAQNTFMLLFLSLFVHINTISAQKERPVILNYQNSSGEKGISFFEYDGNQRIVKGYWQLLDSSRFSNNYYFYNHLGQLTEKYREFSDSVTSSVKYTYNKKGWKIAVDFSRSDGVTGKTVFEYKPNGVLHKIRCKKYNGWFDGEVVYKTRKNENPLWGEIFRDNKKLGDIHLYYTKNGNLKTEKWIIGNRSQTFEWEYVLLPVSYTSPNVFITENNRYRLIEENYSYNNKTGGPSNFKYDEDGKLTQKTFIRSDGIKTLTTFEYDKNGLLKKSFRKYNDGSSATFNYNFNKNRKLVKRSFIHSNGTKGEENYFYSRTGELEKAVWKNFDNWLSGEITFEHAQNGTIKTGIFGGEKFDATLDFSYNKTGNTDCIIWNFSFGEKQEYHFKYINLF